MGNTKENRQGDGQIDDLLDEILQKNMEKEVQKKGGKAVSEKAKKEEQVEIVHPKESGLQDMILEETKKEMKTDEVEESGQDKTQDEPEKEAPADESVDAVAQPSEYLDQIFSEKGEELAERDIRVIEMEAGSESDEDNKITKKDVLSMLVYVCVIFMLTFVIVHYVGQRTRVSGSSMEDTLSDGDNLIVDKLTYRFEEPKRFDVIIFPFQYEEETYYIKRIIGLPGETVQIGQDGSIYINGELLEEDYGLETIQDPGMAVDPIVLGENEYFVLGDNRNNSSDSRFGGVGKVHKDDIIGRAWIRIYPFNKIQKL